jgi:hypothetical protein
VEYKKTLLGAASILALTAATSTPADATLSRQQDQQNVHTTRVAEVPADLTTDPLFDLLARTNGSVTAEAIEKAIPQMFGNATAEQLRNVPEFLSSIATLGASTATLDRAKEALAAVVGSAELTDEFKDVILSRLQAGLRPVQLAQRQRCDPRTGRLRNGRCEPLSTGSTRDNNNNNQGREPGTTGQIGGGYQ